MSPYENRLAFENFRRIGLIATIRPRSEGAFATAARDALARLASPDLIDLRLYTRIVARRTAVFAFLEYRGSEVESVVALLAHDPAWVTLNPYLAGLPGTAPAPSPWLRMELINIIGPTLPTPTAGAPRARLGFVSGLKAESELWYRTLHQTNWPGVVDQMARSHYRHWITFLTEIDGQLLLFTHCEYVGQDKAADDAAMAADPVTRRWWRHTEPCLVPQESGGGSWAPMPSLASFD